MHVRWEGVNHCIDLAAPRVELHKNVAVWVFVTSSYFHGEPLRPAALLSTVTQGPRLGAAPAPKATLEVTVLARRK